MDFAAGLIVGLVFVAAYRLHSYGEILPNSTNETVVAAWLKILAVISIVTLGLWLVLTLVQRFPD